MKGGGLLTLMGGGKKQRNKTGKKKARKSQRGKKRTMKGGSMVTNALLPFGLLTLQQFFQKKTRNNKKGLSNGIKSMRKSMKVKF
jgi:hypothetical protein|tara:strand:+ start:1361 stop:1615 length:255 start_codon:yes stop_codon:yes gene_type:complete